MFATIALSVQNFFLEGLCLHNQYVDFYTFEFIAFEDTVCKVHICNEIFVLYIICFVYFSLNKSALLKYVRYV